MNDVVDYCKTNSITYKTLRDGDVIIEETVKGIEL